MLAKDQPTKEDQAAINRLQEQQSARGIVDNRQQIYMGIGNRIVYRFYTYFVRLFMYPYMQKNSVSTWKYLALKVLLYFDTLRFLGLYSPGIKLYILWSMRITFYNSSSKQQSWLEIHCHLVQAVKIPKNELFLYHSFLLLPFNVSQSKIQ